MCKNGKGKSSWRLDENCAKHTDICVEVQETQGTHSQSGTGP